MADRQTKTDYQLDEIDRRIVYALMDDARGTSAPAVAEETGVSAPTIRNRIDRLEEHGILTGYHASVNFERAESRLTNLYICNAPFADLETLARQAYVVPGVVNVRELMGGRMNLHVLGVGESTSDLRRIGRSLSELGLEIEDEVLVRNESFQPYTPFGPSDEGHRKTLGDFVSLADGAEVVEVVVEADTPLEGETLKDAGERGILRDDTLVIAVERDGAVLTPRGETTIRAGDALTLFSRGGVDDRTISGFLDTTHD